MDNQVELWMQRKSEDTDTEVPSSILKYYFQRSTDERDIQTVVDSHGRNPTDQRCAVCEVIKPKSCFKPNNECCLQCIVKVARRKVNKYF